MSTSAVPQHCLCCKGYNNTPDYVGTVCRFCAAPLSKEELVSELVRFGWKRSRHIFSLHRNDVDYTLRIGPRRFATITREFHTKRDGAILKETCSTDTKGFLRGVIYRIHGVKLRGKNKG